MLTSFAVKNFRTFEDWMVFDLTTNKKYAFNEQAVCNDHIQHAMVYGENGEGKSNLGLAIVELTSHLNPNESRFPNLGHTYLNANSASDLAEFKYAFSINGRAVQYHYGKNSNRDIVYEKLWIADHLAIDWDKRHSLAAKFDFVGAESLNKALSENVKSAVTYVKNNSNLADNTINHTFLSFIDFTEGMVTFKTMERANAFSGAKPMGFQSISEQIIQGQGVQAFQDYLNDAGITCQLATREGPEGNRIVFVHTQRELDFTSTVSSGTFALTILYCWLERMNAGEVTFAYIDEFDAFYHNKLAKNIAKRIINTSAQTVLSTHNTGIMSNDLLRPDCYFELKSGQVKPLHELTDRELRKAHNLEKMYRAGTFDG